MNTVRHLIYNINTTINNLLRIDLVSYKEMNIIIACISSPCTCKSKHHIVYLNYMQFLLSKIKCLTLNHKGRLKGNL